jgi:poly-gamma-glutamate synthesis protein (capsule biosynthesis protein)
LKRFLSFLHGVSIRPNVVLVFGAVVCMMMGCAAPRPKLPAEKPAAEVVSPTPNSTPVAWKSFPGDPVLEAGDHPVTLICVGDLMFGRHVEEASQERHLDNPFESMRDALQSGDLATGNLECVLGDPKSVAKWKSRDKILLPAPIESARKLWNAGFRLVSVGNNHSLDFREEGLFSTLGALKDAGLAWVGIWEGETQPLEPWIFEIRGVKVAFLAYSDVSPPIFRTGGAGHPGTVPPLPELLKRDITYAKSKADLVVVQTHWGVEYQDGPTDRQKMLAHQMIDFGADAVVGHHPHVLQPTERYKGKFIIYSLGNFLFDLKRPITHPGLVLRLRLEKGRVPIADFLPSWSGDMFPRPPHEDEKSSYPDWLRIAPPMIR